MLRPKIKKKPFEHRTEMNIVRKRFFYQKKNLYDILLKYYLQITFRYQNCKIGMVTKYIKFTIKFENRLYFLKLLLMYYARKAVELGYRCHAPVIFPRQQY